MILDSLVNSGLYGRLGPNFAAAFEFLLRFDPATPSGRIPIDGDNLFAVVQRYQTAPAAKRDWEAHRRYADIQLLLSGRERIFRAPTKSLALLNDFNVEKDFGIYSGAESACVALAPGDFAIFMPEEAHKPGVDDGEGSEVLKVVIKVRIHSD